MGKPYTEFLTLQNAVSATANGNVMDVSGYSALAVQVTGTFVATVTFEGSLDNSTWVALQATNYRTGEITFSTPAAGIYYIPVAGLEVFRGRVSWTSGTSITVQARAVSGGGAASYDALGNDLVVKVTGATLAVNTTQYSDGDLVGTLMTLTGVARITGGHVILQSIVVQDLSNQKAALDLIIFDSNPSNTTFTNNSALDIADADLPDIVAKIPIAASDYISFSDNAVGQPEFYPRLIATSGNTTLYACLRSNGATPTYAANELSLVLGFMRD